MKGWASHAGRRRLALAAALVVLGVLAQARIAHAGGFIRLSEIAERYGLTTRYELLSGRRVLSGGGARLIVCPGMRQVVVGARALSLRHAVLCAGGDLLIEAQGAREIAALLGAPPAAPPPARRTSAPAAPSRAATAAGVPSRSRPRATALQPPRRGGLIVIDAGHGGKFTGARARSGLYEKDVNLAVARELARRLERMGWRVKLTRHNDRPLSSNLNADLDARVALANGARADLFVSIHANHAADRSVHGYEIYHYRGSRTGKQFAEAIHHALRRSVPDIDRGVKSAGFRVIKRARMPAVLIETGFMSHEGSARRLGQPAYQRRLAAAIAEGVQAFFDGQRRAATTRRR